MQTTLAEQVQSAINAYSRQLIDKAVAGDLAPEAAAAELAKVIDMAVRRDPEFSQAINLDLQPSA